MINFYPHLIPHIATIAEPLHQLVRKNTTWEWQGQEEQEQSFQKLKELVSQVSVINYSNSEKQFYLYTDVSDVEIGAVLL